MIGNLWRPEKEDEAAPVESLFNFPWGAALVKLYFFGFRAAAFFSVFFTGLFATFFAAVGADCFFAGAPSDLLSGAIISTVFATRRALVSGFLASSIALMYSFR